LEVENLYLREAAGALGGAGEVIGKSEGIKRVMAAVERVAPTNATVLLTGETGTGKDLIANAIHRLSTRRDHPMVKLNCAALVPSLIEAELFGREKGAYTGALSRQVGRFELAHGSTIFLDEIAELSPDLQVKLLRVLQEGELQRVGGTQTITIDVRVVAATNRDLPAAVRSGRFREDLFYRLNVFPIEVPPLRERKEDIPLLVWAFAKELGEAFGKPVERIPQETMDALQQYSWPGNIRELRNVIERALILGDSSTLRVTMPLEAAARVPGRETIKESERRLILEALERSGWRIRGRDGAAELLGLKPSTLEYRVKRHGLKKPS
jgi:transcriptional regulator with GAF, ATPase, and Fis domain